MDTSKAIQTMLQTVGKERFEEIVKPQILEWIEADVQKYVNVTYTDEAERKRAFEHILQTKRFEVARVFTALRQCHLIDDSYHNTQINKIHSKLKKGICKEVL